jgi:hypothetical protein
MEKHFCDSVNLTHLTHISIDKAPADTAVGWPGGGDSHGPQMAQDTKICCGLFQAESFLLPEGNILDPCYEVWE